MKDFNITALSFNDVIFLLHLLGLEIAECKKRMEIMKDVPESVKYWNDRAETCEHIIRALKQFYGVENA